MSASPSPSSVLAQCTVCAWQGRVEPQSPGYHRWHYERPCPPSEYLSSSCTRCGAMRLIDRSTQASSHA